MPTVSTIVAGTVGAFLAGCVGGALSGMVLAGKDLGNGLAAAMGALFGPVAATPGVLAGLVLLRFF